MWPAQAGRSGAARGWLDASAPWRAHLLAGAPRALAPRLRCGDASGQWLGGAAAAAPGTTAAGSEQQPWQQRRAGGRRPCSGVPAAAAAAAAAAAPAVAAAEAASAPFAEAGTEARLYALYEFARQNGRPPQVQDSHRGVAVGQWAEACRLRWQQGALGAQLAAALESVPGWSWQPQTHTLETAFEEALQALRQHAMQHGHLPRIRASRRADAGGGGPGEGGQALRGRAAAEPSAACRQVLEQRRRGVLTQRQIDRVSTAVPGWKWDARVRSPPLDGVIHLLCGFWEQHGRLPRQTERLPDGFQLGEWCTARRGEYSRGQLERDVAEALAAGVPGWSWNLVGSAFEQNLEVLKRFQETHGRLPTQREELGGVRIGAWCNKRRLQYKQGGLPADRAAVLEALPGWWWTADGMDPQ